MMPCWRRITAAISAAFVPLLILCLPTSGRAQSTGPAATDILPFADYHTHLYSATVDAHRIPPPLPAVELPAGLASLLQRRVALAAGPEVFRNRVALAPLYTSDAVFQNTSFDIWNRGAEKASVNATLQATFAFWGDSFQMTPVAYGADDSMGYIAGYYVGKNGARVGQFQLSLRKSDGGEWKIAAETSNFEARQSADEILPEQLIANLDKAGMRKALVLSSAYWHGGGPGMPADEYARVRAENDWVAKHVASYPDRLVGFCSFNPLRDYALAEIERCADHPHLSGIKMHMADSNVDLENPVHVEKLREVFRAANQHRLPIAAHLATQDFDYGTAHVRIYLEKIFAMAPDIPIQIAHLAGHGPSHGGEALEAFAQAAVDRHPQMRNVYFDVSSNVLSNMDDAYLTGITKHLRQIGVDRILFATDWPAGGKDVTQAKAWAQFRRLGLTDAELRTIAGNVAGYMK